MFKKRKNAQADQFFANILNSQDSDIIVVRGKMCDTLFMNSAATARIAETNAEESCPRGYATLFPNLCSHCVHTDESTPTSDSFDVTDIYGCVFSASCKTIDWTDGQPATMLTLRNVDNERNSQKKLYSLAYMDHLTGVPNRQKFKEDYEAIAEGVISGRLSGLVAIFDLDHFKTVNDTYGHNTGDIMLKRLTDHLEALPAFTGHLYRLGGDEFVLLYSNPISRFDSDESMQTHYEELLRGAFLNYTMPNIEISCTISMGVAFFPTHGTTNSELLRKSDIALYKAKAAGRNSLVFFEDKYDTAKKFKDLYINIQPILTHQQRTFGYELIDSGENNDESGQELSLSEFDRTMDTLGLGDLENDARYFIAFASQLLNKSVRSNLPKNKFVVEIPLAAPPSSAQLKQYIELRSYGYSLALKDVSLINTTPQLMELADYVKFAPGALDPHEQRQFIAANPEKRFIATGVDTDTAFEDAQRRGYKLFQGFFFSYPPAVLKKTKDIDPLKVNYYRLIKLTSTDDYVDFREISTVISSDLALSYKLLRLLNSAAVGLRNQVSSIEMAVAFLGEESLKKWISMLALRGIASDKPLELVRISLIRARFGELLAPHFTPRRNTKHVFLTGMFSLLHIALEKSKEELLDEIPVAEDIRQSLLTSTGPHSDLLVFYSDYEYANWDEVSVFAKENSLNDELINDAYIAAVKWYNNLTEPPD